MKSSLKFFAILAFLALASSVFAQSDGNNKGKGESSVEEEYLSDVDGLVILSMALADDYETKLEAIQMIETSIDNGNANPDIMKALSQLAGEGITSQARTNGRIVNNFPDLRRRACLTLGKVKTEEAKNFLLEVALAESEPTVISAAVNSLGEIGLNKNDDVVAVITFANRRNQLLHPTSSLASEVVDCYEKLVDSTEDKRKIIDSLTQIASDYHYNKVVRTKAYALLRKLSDSSSSSSNKNSNGDKNNGGNQ